MKPNFKYRCSGQHEGGGDHVFTTTVVPTACPDCGSGEHLEMLPDEPTVYVRKLKDGTVEITSPSDGMSPAEAKEYLDQVHAQIAQVATIKPAVKDKLPHRVYLANGRRGGYFADTGKAVVELLTEIVDLSRKARTQAA